MEIFTTRPDSTLNLDVLTATANGLRELLQNGKVSLRLNAMINTAPKKILLDIAKSLDDECALLGMSGPLHGTPATMKHNAPIVDHHSNAGMAIIGKANLSVGALLFYIRVATEHCNHAVGGQTQSPYIVGGLAKGEKLLGQTALVGSSSGSASSVVAGFAPLAIATEIDGSITQPASRAALFGIKVTVGRASTEGTASWSALTDSIGGMAKSARDLAYLVDVVLDTISLQLYTQIRKVKLLAFQQREAYIYTKKNLVEHGATLHESVPLNSVDELQFDGDDALDQLWNHDYAKAWEKFLENFPSSSMNSIAEIVKFNKLNAKVALPAEHPGQQLLESALEDKMPQEKYVEGVSLIREAAKTNGIEKTIHQFGLDVIVGPIDGRKPTIAAAAGHPVGTVPLGYTKTMDVHLDSLQQTRKQILRETTPESGDR
ncbi:hypothetical protein BPOR_0287g00110 [Botrytis porri]|uniref:Amidase domain-containing protein n=1 Tax=Botrytis porri TaxID=87229 RepID=A0A4Z1KKQ7_9HELO|nr:hypothetical protein BPOR_0287g00110 [Botrytis porri]